MEDLITLYVSEDSESRTQVFTLPNATFADIGDLLECDGEFFTVNDTVTTFAESSEHKLISSLCTIHPAEAVYFCRWRAGNE